MYNNIVQRIREIYNTQDFIPLHEPKFIGNEKKYLKKCIKSGFISSSGPFVEKFEKKFAKRVKRKFAISVSNGTAALQLAFESLNIKKKEEVIVWGNGKSTRDFCYVEDVAKGIILAAEKYNKSDPINLASGNETSIKEIAEVIKKKIGYEGKITWDENKPSGPKRRVVDINKAKKEFGYQAKTSLREGIDETVDWYIAKNLNLDRNTLS